MVSLFSTYFSYLRKRRLALFVFMLAITVVFVFFAFNIELEEDITKAIPFGKQGAKYQKVLKNFKFLDRIVFRVFHTDGNGDHKVLAQFADEFTSEMKKSPAADQINSYSADNTAIDTWKLHAHFYNYLPLYLDDKKYDDLENLNEKSVAKTLEVVYRTMVSPAGMISAPMLRKDPLGLSFQAMEKLKTLNPEDNFTVLDRHIFTKDKKNLIFFIQPGGSAVETNRNAELVQEIKKIIAELSEKSDGRISAEFAGGLPIAVGSADRIKTDVILSSMIAILLVFFILLFHFRKIRFIPLIFLPAVFGAVTAVAVAWFVKTEISAIALGVTSVLLGITVDYAIHTVSHILKTRDPGKAISDISFPMILSCFTTVSAFACLLLLDSPVLNDLGLLASVSVFSAMLFSITVLPHIVDFLGVSKKDIPFDDTKGIIGFFASKEFEKSRILVSGVLALTVVLYFLSGDVQFEDDLNSINYIKPEVQRALDNLDKISDVNKKSVYLVFEGSDLNEVLKKRESAQDVISKYHKKGEIEAYNDVAELLLSKEKQGQRIEKWNSFWTREKKDKLIGLFKTEGTKVGFKEETFEEFYKLLDKKFQIVEPTELIKFAPHLFTNWVTLEKQVMSATLMRIDPEKSSELSSALEKETGAFYFDRAGLMHKFVKFLKHDFEKLLLFSIIAVFLILFFLSGRLELAIAAIIPVAFSWLWTLGFMSILGLKFNIVNIIIVTFIFGLGIDYVAFIMRAKMQEYTYGDKKMAVSYKSSILVSCFTTIAGVGALIAAVHPALRSIALIAVLGMVSTLINSFVLAPAIFDWMLIKQKKKKAPPHTFLVFAYTFISYANYVGFSLGLSGLGFGIFTTLPFRSAEKKRKVMYHFLIRIAARAVIFFAPHVRLRLINRHNVDLSKPSVIIANHQSFLDILMMLSLKTKIVMVTKSWVSNNPVFGKLVQFADFFTITEGFEKMAPELQKCIDDGYSVVVFPEGTRGDGKKLARFHKGAFFLAEKLKLDIVPIVLHGSGHSIKRGEFSVRASHLTYYVLPEVKYGSNEYGETYQEVCKGVSKNFKKEYARIYEELGDVDFFRDRLIKNYIYKGPDIEWYVRVKTKLEKNYRFFDEIIPRNAVVTDLGCGMGMMVYMLYLTSNDRKFIAVDYDKGKISVAENCFLNNERTRFINADVLESEPENSDVFVLNDVLHYLPEETHESVIMKCAQKLNEGGFIIIRDGDKELEKSHKNTEMTEKFSTGLGFNKTKTKLAFISGEMIERIASRLGFTYEILKTQDKTSNRVFVLRKMEKTDV